LCHALHGCFVEDDNLASPLQHSKKMGKKKSNRKDGKNE